MCIVRVGDSPPSYWNSFIVAMASKAGGRGSSSRVVEGQGLAPAPIPLEPALP